MFFLVSYQDHKVTTYLDSGEVFDYLEPGLDTLSAKLRVNCDTRPREIASTFDSSLEGWTKGIGCLEIRDESGYLFVDNSEQEICILSAPEKFRGPGDDLSYFYGGTISFDARIIEALDPTWDERYPGGGEGNNYGTVTISGRAGAIAIDLAAVPIEPASRSAPWSDWQTHSAPITAGEWINPATGQPATEAHIQAVLAAVSGLSLNVEAVYGREKHGIDNVRLTAPF
jgi:hypothetical protein